MRLLVDMDEVIAGFLPGLDVLLDSYGDERAGIRRAHEHADWDMTIGLTDAQKATLSRALATPGLFRGLLPLPGALEALNEMLDAGHDVRIVTSPMSSNPTCASDKLAWISEHLGEDWRKRVIITDDKTVIRGDVLFDDKGKITGSMVPMWRQILVDQPHNRGAAAALPRVASLAHWQVALDEMWGAR